MEWEPRHRLTQQVGGLAFEIDPGPAGFFYSKKEAEELEQTNVNSTAIFPLIDALS